MSFISKVKEYAGKYSKALKDIADKQAAEANERAEAKLEKAKSEKEKLEIKAARDIEKARIYNELAEAQEAGKKAAIALKKAKREAGDLTAEEKVRKAVKSGAKGISDFQSGLKKLQKDIDNFGKPKRKKKTTNVKTTRKPATRKKPPTSKVTRMRK